jgi:nucleoside-diphosphate-sugar epimerase
MNIAVIGTNSILAQAIIRAFEQYEPREKKHVFWQVYNHNTEKIKTCIYPENRCSTADFFTQNPPIDLIYFIAAFITNDESVESVRRIFVTNVTLLEQVSTMYPAAKIIHASSVAVYRHGADKFPVDEQTLPQPESCYAKSKLIAENIVTKHRGGGINIRISSLFGVEMTQNTFLPKIIINALQQQEIRLVGNINRLQNYISADQAALFFYLAHTHNPIETLGFNGNTPFLATHSRSYSNIEIAETVKTILGDKIKITIDNSNPTLGIINYVYDNRRSREILDIDRFENTTTDLHTLLTPLILWLKKQYS